MQRITGTSPQVDAAMCTACGLHWATTVINPALAIVGLLPTPQLRTAAPLAVLCTEITQRAQAREHTMAETVCFPVTEVISIGSQIATRPVPRRSLAS